jgi:hypothetical protein
MAITTSGEGGAGALSSITSILNSMIPVMTAAAQAQITMSLVMAVLNVAKTAASDVEDASKKS